MESEPRAIGQPHECPVPGTGEEPRVSDEVIACVENERGFSMNQSMRKVRASMGNETVGKPGSPCASLVSSDENDDLELI